MSNNILPHQHVIRGANYRQGMSTCDRVCGEHPGVVTVSLCGTPKPKHNVLRSTPKLFSLKTFSVLPKNNRQQITNNNLQQIITKKYNTNNNLQQIITRKYNPNNNLQQIATEKYNTHHNTHTIMHTPYNTHYTTPR